ncbi:uncharacterized protein LOC116585489 [Mustela erminea]|uniref:uncharacterized protein LOC116585489 n=1 Tax=Mustela erminea TaxID=36723 RepID=UPI001387355E|nr:uncharacterized protein LOC116585489 [Mustela erminea]
MLQAEKSGLHGVNSNSRRVGKEAQAASGSSRCSGRSLPQPGAPPGRPLAARSRAVMLPCPSSERGLTYGREGRRTVSGGQAPPRSAAVGSARTPKPSVRRLGLLPALPSPGRHSLSQGSPLRERVPVSEQMAALRSAGPGCLCSDFSLPELSHGVWRGGSLICRRPGWGRGNPAPDPGAPYGPGAPASTLLGPGSRSSISY